jgi:hypothetical protein
MNMKSVQNINISYVQKLWVNMVISWIIECSTSWMPHQRTFRNSTHQAWAIWYSGNHNLFWIIPDPVCQKRITFYLESICTIPFQAGTSDVKIPEWGQHCATSGMPCFVRILAPVGVHGISATTIHALVLGICWICFRMLPIVRYSGHACWLPGTLDNWVLSDAQLTGTIVAPAGSWCCQSHHQSPVFISRYICELPRLPGALVHNPGAPAMGHAPKRTEYICKYPNSIMCQRYVNYLQSNYHHWAQNRFQRRAFTKHLQIEMIWFWSYPVHASDADSSTFLFVG